MTVKELTCIECPLGCKIEVGLEGDEIKYIRGYSCPRGKMYAENEIICPMRVVTSTVRADNGRLIPVKTDLPVKKSAIFEVMEKINAIVCASTVKIGDIIMENISDGANLIATGEL